MILRLWVIITYRLTMIIPSYIHVVVYLISPIVCFGICVKLYDVLQKISPKLLGVLVGYRLK